MNQPQIISPPINPKNIRFPLKLGLINMIFTIFKILFSLRMIAEVFIKIISSILQIKKHILYGEVLNSIVKNINQSHEMLSSNIKNILPVS
jgi:hypothetical protein